MSSLRSNSKLALKWILPVHFPQGNYSHTMLTFLICFKVPSQFHSTKGLLAEGCTLFQGLHASKFSYCFFREDTGSFKMEGWGKRIIESHLVLKELGTDTSRFFSHISSQRSMKYATHDARIEKKKKLCYYFSYIVKKFLYI